MFARLTVAIMPIDGVKDLVQASLLIFQHPWEKSNPSHPQGDKLDGFLDLIHLESCPWMKQVIA